jgi:small subunit ribosomal protein S3
MGQKVHPIGFRVGYEKSWNSIWCETKSKDYSNFIVEDYKIRHYLNSNKRRKDLNICNLKIIRSPNKINIIIYSSRAANIIGKDGSNLTKIISDLKKLVPSKDISIDIKQEKNPEATARHIAEIVATSIEKRMSVRRVMLKAVESAMENRSVAGISIKCSGRLGGAEMARSDSMKKGILGMHTIKNHLSHHSTIAETTYGVIGVSVTISLKERYSKSTNN